MSQPRVNPPAYFLIALLVMVGLNIFAPIMRVLDSPWRFSGAAVMLGGGLLSALGSRLFDKRGTTVKPFEDPTALITEGPFAYSRNPMYLGMVILLAGVAIVLGSLSTFVVIPVFIWFITTRFIVPEEHALEQHFGPTYLKYKESVRRWL